MIQYVSDKGGGKPVDFETAILDDSAANSGLYISLANQSRKHYVK